MLRSIYITFILMLFLTSCTSVSQCVNNTVAPTEPSTIHDVMLTAINTIDNETINYPGQIETSNVNDNSTHLLGALTGFGGSVENVLHSAAMLKFNEGIDQAEWRRRRVGLENLTALYEPAVVMDGANFIQISAVAGNSVDFVFDERSIFSWSRNTPVENAVTAMFGRGAIYDRIEEHNGITYGISEFTGRGSGGFFNICWTQHGKSFRVALSSDYTLEQALAFAYAVPIHSWELDGNAVSVIAQGVGELAINDLSRADDQSEIIVEGDALYLRSPGNIFDRVGYRWLIDEQTQRFQYVLKPGEYAFSITTELFALTPAEDFATADTPTRRSTPIPELTVTHFTAGQAISRADITETIQSMQSDLVTLLVTENTEMVQVAAGGVEGLVR